MTIAAKLLGCILVLVMAAGFGAVVEHWRMRAEVSDIKAKYLKDVADQSQEAMAKLVSASETVNKSAKEFSNVRNSLGVKLDALSKDIRNAQKLPADCKPTPDRVQSLRAAIAAANEAASSR